MIGYYDSLRTRVYQNLKDSLVPVAETVSVIPAEAGIQLFRSGSLLPAFAGTSLHLRKQMQG